MKLCIPEKLLEQHLVVLGKTGKGKSSALRHIVEHLLQRGKRVCIIDPKGDWWGIKADGTGPGFPVIAFGDFKNLNAQDVPINEKSGKHIAELITSGNRPCVIGFRGWMPGQMVRFWIDFAPALFNANSGELYLIGDEFHNFAPKGKILDPEAGKCLHWSNRMMSEGRGVGLICMLASQRPQKVHNDTLTCCETLVAMGVNHPADRAAVKDWIDGCGNPEQGNEVLNSLAGMGRGEAYVWSPENKFGPIRLTFPMFETFDSFAPPQLQKKISNAGWADVDLDAVKQKLATVIEEAKANNPQELQKQLRHANAENARICRELVEMHNRRPAESKPKEIPALTNDNRKRLTKLIDGFAKFKESVDDVRRKIETITLESTGTEIRFIRDLLSKKLSTALPKRTQEPTTVRNARPTVPIPALPIVRRPVPPISVNGESPIGKCERSLLSVLAKYPEGCMRNKLILLAGYAWSGSTQNSLSKLRSLGFVEGQNNSIIRITQAGLSSGNFEPLPEGPDLINYWLTYPYFGRCERTLLQCLIDNPNGLNREELIAAAGYEWSGSTQNALGTLRTAGVIIGRNNETMKASNEFFQ